MTNVSSSYGKNERPKLRFPGFDEPWSSCRLSNIGQAFSGYGFPEKFQGEDTNEIPFYKVSDMNLAGNEQTMTVANNYISLKTADEMKVHPFENDSVIFAKVGATISHERKRIAFAPFLIDNNMMAFTPFREKDLRFIFHLFQKIKLSKYIQIGALPSYNLRIIIALISSILYNVLRGD